MTNTKATRNAFFGSTISLLLCVAMLVGSTFAWFTDTATTKMNKIIAGDLEVQIVDEEGNEKTDELKFVVNKDGSAATENGVILWEPGVRFNTEKFAIKNNGNLALKFKLEINNTEVSYNKLNEVIDFTLYNAKTNEAIDFAKMVDIKLDAEAKTDNYYIQGHMKESADSSYEGLELDGVSITVYATQQEAEADSYGTDYDKEATYDGKVITVTTADEFLNSVNALEEGGTITLTGNVDLTGKDWTPINNMGFTLDGNGYTITGMSDALVGTTAAKNYTVKDVTFKDLNINACYGGIAVGLIAYADTCAYINMENVTIDGANITGAEYVGGFAGYTTGYGNDNNGPVNASHNFTNCTIKNATLTSSTDGAVGGLIGHAGGNLATTTRISGFNYSNLNLKQTTERTDKLGWMIGTCGCGVVYISDDITTENSAEIGYIGRFVPAGTGKLVINSKEIAAFDGNGN